MNLSTATDRTDKILSAIRAMDQSRTKQDVFEVVNRFAEDLGYTHTTLGSISHPDLRDIRYDDLGVSNFPIGFQERYVEQNYLLHDPIVRLAHTSRDAFTWSEAMERGSAKGRRVLMEGRDFALKTGLSLPLHLEGCPKGVVSFAGPETEDYCAEDRQALELIGMHGFTRLLELIEANDSVPRQTLTARETEAVYGIAAGLTNREIADRMNVKSDAVKEYIAKARRKLGARNRSHCVMVAIRDGHIFL